MGKGSKQTQTTDQTQTADSNFSNQQFLQNLASQFQQSQQQQAQSQTGTQTSQQATGVDANSQAFIDQMRQHALGSLGSIGAGNFAPGVGQINQLTQQLQNPYTQQVVQGVGQQFDQLRDQARMGTQQQATAAGAFGGSRHGVAEAQRLAELDRAQTQQQGALLAQGFQGAQQAAIPLAQQQAMAPAQAAMAQQQLLRGGLGPTGQVSTGVQQSMQDLISQLTGSQFGTSSQQQTGMQSGSQSATGTMQGKTTNKQSGDLFGDLLGAGLAIASFIPGPHQALTIPAAIGQASGGGANA